MRRAYSIPEDLPKSAGEHSRKINGVCVWRVIQVALAVGCTEQTVSLWARHGKIPCGYLLQGVRWFSKVDLELMARNGVLEVGHYFGEQPSLPPHPDEVPPATVAAKKRTKSSTRASAGEGKGG